MKQNHCVLGQGIARLVIGLAVLLLPLFVSLSTRWIVAITLALLGLIYLGLWSWGRRSANENPLRLVLGTVSFVLALIVCLPGTEPVLHYLVAVALILMGLVELRRFVRFSRDRRWWILAGCVAVELFVAVTLSFHVAYHLTFGIGLVLLGVCYLLDYLGLGYKEKIEPQKSEPIEQKVDPVHRETPKVEVEQADGPKTK